MSQLKKINPWDEVAQSYNEEIISPIHHYKSNPLFEYLKKIKFKKNLHAADLGCGTGDLIPILAKKFKHVTAMDFSYGMIEKSNSKIKALKPDQAGRVTLIRDTLTNLSKYSGSFDVVMTINSIISNNLLDIEAIFKGLYDSLKKDGIFLGILPSLESIREEYQYTYLKELKQYKSHQMASAKTNKKMEINRVNFALGLYNTDDMEQKYFSHYEIKNYLEKMGFRKIQFDRVVYEKGHSYNYGEDDLKGHPLMWDWFVKAEK